MVFINSYGAPVTVDQKYEPDAIDNEEHGASIRLRRNYDN